ncbi:hypothetical protein EDD16DRAFT_1899622 [Pisolithus croceorrhizus]|nr:hypothetical protein EDD16DRAFT_1899622 [Pisolithus croceorrhizus]KAI6167556.1 hypothetical protein EDD17DRAFT_1870078 [Pisolithus thermaeus]
MPDYIRSHLRFSVELHESTYGDPFGSRSGQLESYRSPTDVPRTPSPPSSSESFLFVGSSTRLSEDFTRGIVSSRSLTEIEDWMLWSSSPPRPIPALHGPLSLPYARCPSGAEGTIIEEPGNVSRVIWGLGSDDQPSAHPKLLEGGRFGRAEPLIPQPPSPCPFPMQKKLIATSQRHDKQSRPWPLRTGHKQPAPIMQALTQQPSREVKHHHGDQCFNAVSNYYSCDEAPPVTDGMFSRLQSAHVPRSLDDFDTDLGEHLCVPQDSRLVAASSLHGFLRASPRIFVEPRLTEPNSQASNDSTMDTAQLSHQHLYQRGKRTQEVQQVPVSSGSSSSLRPSCVPSRHWPAASFPLDGVVSPVGLDNIHLQTHRFGVKSSSQSQSYHQHARDLHGDTDDLEHLDMRVAYSVRSLPQNPNNRPSASVRRNTMSPNTLANHFTQMQMQSLPGDTHRPVPSSASTGPAPLHPVIYGTHNVGVGLTGTANCTASTIISPDSA